MAHQTTEKTNLRIPGPTPVPVEIRQAAARPMMNHRGAEFVAIMNECQEGLKEILQTKNDTLILTASGTGGLEAAVVNCLSPGDRVLAVSIGYFGQRFANIASAYGADVRLLSFPSGCWAEPAAVANALRDDPSIKAVLITHNETSTGVTNPLAEIAEVVRNAGTGRHRDTPLLLVDAISSAACIELRTDAWRLDVVVSGSQKGWMCPPGLAFVALSQRAWQAYQTAAMPRFYFDLGKARKSAEEGATPWTPAVSVVYALQHGLRMLCNEGMEQVVARHHRIGQRVRQGVQELGLKLVVPDERYASDTVTAVRAPADIDPKTLRKRMLDEYDIVLAGAQGDLSGSAFRIGHLGYVSEEDINGVLAALRQVLARTGTA